MRRLAGMLAVAAVGFVGFAGCKGGDDKARKAETTTPAPAPVEVAEPAGEVQVAQAQPFLWEANKDGHSVLLFGTMHLGVSLLHDVNPLVLERLANAKTFVMEADISTVDGQELMKMARLSGDERLDKMLSPERWDQLVELMGLMPPKELVHLKPWFVIVNLSQSILPTLAPMDSVLRTTAEGNGAKVAFLETWQYQIELLDDVMGADDLARMVEDFEGTKKDLLGLAESYKRGDEAAVSKVIFDPEEYAKNPKLIDWVLVRRNKEWMPHIEKYAATGDTFVAVGLGHLIGDQGVLAMLEQQGYTVTRAQ